MIHTLGPCIPKALLSLLILHSFVLDLAEKLCDYLFIVYDQITLSYTKQHIIYGFDTSLTSGFLT